MLLFSQKVHSKIVPTTMWSDPTLQRNYASKCQFVIILEHPPPTLPTTTCQHVITQGPPLHHVSMGLPNVPLFWDLQAVIILGLQ